MKKLKRLLFLHLAIVACLLAFTPVMGASVPEKPTEYVWVGDCHVTAFGMYIGNVTPGNGGYLNRADGKGNYWSSKVGYGLPWMKTTGMPNVAGRLSSGKALIIWMGTNDAYYYSIRVPEYIAYLNELAKTYGPRGVKIFFVNVGRIYDPRSKYLKNYMSEAFNNQIRNGIAWNDQLHYIDVYAHTRYYTPAQITSDGFHYQLAECKEIYNWIIAQVNDCYKKEAAAKAKPSITGLKEMGMGKLRMQCVNRKDTVNGYQFKWALDKEMTKSVKTASSAKHFIIRSGLIGGKTYYVKVRTYRTEGGKKVYSEWSSVKSIRLRILPPEPVPVSLEKKGSGFRCSWEIVPSVDGYQIAWSTDPSFKPFKTSSVTGAERDSITKRNLEKDQTYYVKIRSFIIAADGTRYYSKWTSAGKI